MKNTSSGSGMSAGYVKMSAEGGKPSDHTLDAYVGPKPFATQIKGIVSSMDTPLYSADSKSGMKKK